jgi:tRNA threonylcarbamoyladenosine biosynthesis protein TsaE
MAKILSPRRFNFAPGVDYKAQKRHNTRAWPPGHVRPDGAAARRPRPSAGKASAIIPNTHPYLPGEIYLPGPEATRAAGAALAKAVEEREVERLMVGLSGPLGAGKTTLAQGLAVALGVAEGEAVSPTFTLANVYQGRRALAHLDLYRLGENPLEEFRRAGLEESLDGLCLVEWPERLGDDFWPGDRLTLELDHNEVGRWLRARGSSAGSWELWRAVVEAMGDPD